MEHIDNDTSDEECTDEKINFNNAFGFNIKIKMTAQDYTNYGEFDWGYKYCKVDVLFADLSHNYLNDVCNAINNITEITNDIIESIILGSKSTYGNHKEK